MYTTIEADIDNGMIRAAEGSRLPKHAHVLVTLLPSAMQVECNTRNESTVRAPHPDLTHSVEVCGDLLHTVSATDWDLPQ